jgi:starch synthase
MRVLYIASEVAPFSKTGGLADVAAALPVAVARAGHGTRVFTPLYSTVDAAAHGLVEAKPETYGMWLGDKGFEYSLWRGVLPGTDVAVDFIRCPALFDRGAVYTGDADEHLRFVLLQRAALESVARQGWAPDIVHCHDWHTALAPLYLKTAYADDAGLGGARSVLTLHNLGYQGLFSADVVGETGLASFARYLHQDDLAADRFNFLKTGILYADALTTVSPTYAREIQTSRFGFGLDELLRHRAADLIGILNGIDTEEWNPRTDDQLEFRYSIKSLWRKEKNKESLLADCRLPYEKGKPVIGMVGRLTVQKGIDLLDGSLANVLNRHDACLVVLGHGEERYARFFRTLQEAMPEKVFFYSGFNATLAHRIEAGADMFLMPSIYEPCGLNQMYSLMYGTIPIVHKTGGLADTVTLFDPATGEGNGIVFDHATTAGVQWALETALSLHADPTTWKRIVANAMTADFSWDRQAAEYLAIYRRLAGENLS